jgi:hypothetical protein
MQNRSYLMITYTLFHHLDKLPGTAKANCLSVYLSIMKYAWKKNNYKCGLRHSTIQADTKLSRTTIYRTLITLRKLNIIQMTMGRSGKTYHVNSKFLRIEKEVVFKSETPMFQKNTRNVSNIPTLEEQYLSNQYVNRSNKVVTIIRDNIGNKDILIDKLSELPLKILKEDTNNKYYCKLAMIRKEEIAASENATYVSPNKIVSALNKIKKETNIRYKEKKEYNIRNGIKPWENK